MYTHVGERRVAAEKLVLDVLREVERALVAVLVRHEVDDEHEEDVDDALADDGVHLDLLQPGLAHRLQLRLVRQSDSHSARRRRTTTLQNCCTPLRNETDKCR